MRNEIEIEIEFGDYWANTIQRPLERMNWITALNYCEEKKIL